MCVDTGAPACALCVFLSVMYVAFCVRVCVCVWGGVRL